MKPDLGAWKEADLSRTATSFAGFGADDRIPPQIRLVGNVAKLVRLREAIARDAPDPKLPAVFVLTSGIVAHKGLTRVPMLNNGTTRLNGRIWLVSPAVNSGFCAEAPADDEEMFGFVSGTLDWGGLPAAIYDPRGEPAIRFYVKGLSVPEECDVIPVGGRPVTATSVFSAIDIVHAKCLITPDAQSVAGKLWQKSEKCWPVENAERIVQLNLKVGLSTYFPECTVRDEQPTPVGRTDLEIEEHLPLQPGVFIRHALVELKVLRSFTSGGNPVPNADTLEWIDEGVGQAHQYGIEKGARLATLCCFDMRTSDDEGQCFQGVRQKAAGMKVILRKWFLYSSSKVYRKVSER